MTFFQRLRALFAAPVTDDRPGRTFELDYDSVNYDEVVFAWAKKRIEVATSEEQEDMWHDCMAACYNSQRGANN